MKLPLIACALLAAGTANAAILDFNGDICSGGLACADGNRIDQSYGDITGVDVQYDARPGLAGLDDFLFWSTQYSDLVNVAYHSGGATLSFLAAAGYSVTLSSLDLGAYPNRDKDLGFSVTDLFDDSTVFDTGIVTVSGATRSSFSPNVTSDVGLKITFLGDFFNGAADNIVYSATPTGDPNVIPLPATALLLLGGIGGLAAFRRRKAA